MHLWIGLCNPQSETYNKITGYLKLSISVTTAGDEQVEIKEDTNPETTESNIKMPTCIQQECYQIRFMIFKAEKLPAMDT